MDTALALDYLVPSAKYGGVPGSTESEHDALRWNDERPKPTWNEVVAADAAAQLALVYATKTDEIRDAAEEFLTPWGREYGGTERATWDQQYAEAQAVLADHETGAPLLTAIASARGQSVANLAQHIVDNRAAWVLLSGHVVGQRLAYQDALDAAHDAEDLAAMLAVEPVYTMPG